METIALTPWVGSNKNVRARLEFKLPDLWVGVFWNYKYPFLEVWICLVPCFPIHIVWNNE